MCALVCKAPLGGGRFKVHHEGPTTSAGSSSFPVLFEAGDIKEQFPCSLTGSDQYFALASGSLLSDCFTSLKCSCQEGKASFF